MRIKLFIKKKDIASWCDGKLIDAYDMDGRSALTKYSEKTIEVFVKPECIKEIEIKEVSGMISGKFELYHIQKQ